MKINVSEVIHNELEDLKAACDRINKQLEKTDLDDFERKNLMSNQSYVMSMYIKKGGSLTELMR